MPLVLRAGSVSPAELQLFLGRRQEAAPLSLLHIHAAPWSQMRLYLTQVLPYICVHICMYVYINTGYIWENINMGDINRNI